MSPHARNRLLAVSALLVAGAGLAYLAMGDLEENLVYYWSPGELLKQGERGHGPTVRLGGVVKPGSIQWDADRTELQFVLADDHKAGAAQVTIRSKEVPPQMFRDGIGVVVEGAYSRANVFESNRLMVNHSNEYRAPHEGDPSAPRDWKETVQSTTTASVKSTP